MSDQQTRRNRETARTGRPAPTAAETANYEDTLDLLELMYRLIAGWKLIVCLSLAFVLAAGVITVFFITPMYEATATIYVLNRSDSAINMSDLQTGNALTSDYIKVFSMWEVYEEVISNLGLSYTYPAMKSHLTVDRLILQMRQHVAAKIASTMLAAGPAYTHGSDILSVFQTPGQQTVIVVLHKDGGHITGGMKLNVELVIGTVGQIHAAGRVGHRDEGVIDLLPLTGSLAVVMHGIGKEYRLVQAAAKVENLAGTGALFTVFPTGHALHFFRADGGVKRLSNNRRFMVHIFHDSKFLSWCCDWIGIS